MRENLDVIVGTVIGTVISLGIIYWMSTWPEKVCVATEKQTLPLYSQGPKHHIKGPLIGYVEKDVCTKYDVKPVNGKKPLVWPDPVY